MVGGSAPTGGGKRKRKLAELLRKGEEPFAASEIVVPPDLEDASVKDDSDDGG